MLLPEESKADLMDSNDSVYDTLGPSLRVPWCKIAEPDGYG
jgi:hypothetical protein